MKLDLYKSICDEYKNRDIFRRYEIIVTTIHNTKYSSEKYNIELDEDTITVSDNKGFLKINDVEIDVSFVSLNLIN